jgi:putative transposase
MATPKRLPWLYTDFPIHFLTTCTSQRRQILADAAMHEAFVKFAMNAPDNGVWVGRYVLMPDHLHLFAGFGPTSMSLPKWVKALKNSMSKALRDGGLAPPHWEKGYFDHVIRSAEWYEEKWNYVRENPVRRELVLQAEDWPFAGEISELAIWNFTNARS